MCVSVQEGSADLVGIIESIYDVEQQTTEWIAAILQRLDPTLGDGTDLFGFEYSFSVDGALNPSSFTTGGRTVLGDTQEVTPVALASYCISHGPFERACVAASETPGWSKSREAASARRAGIVDAWGIIGCSPERQGLAVFALRRVLGAPSNAQRTTFQFIAKHFASAYRLRARLRAIAVVAGSTGRRGIERTACRRATVLTPRERDVLESATLGHTNKEIAYALGIEHSTVRVLLTRAGKKLGAQDRKTLLRMFEELAD